MHDMRIVVMRYSVVIYHLDNFVRLYASVVFILCVCFVVCCCYCVKFEPEANKNTV